MNITQFKIRNCRPYAKGWQINVVIDGVESEETFYHYTKADAIAHAKRKIAQNGRLAHEPYRAEA